MISVEWNAQLRAVSLFVDRAGIGALKRKLDELESDQDHLHLHLGEDLTDSGRMDAVFGELVLEFVPEGVSVADAARRPIVGVR